MIKIALILLTVSFLVACIGFILLFSSSKIPEIFPVKSFIDVTLMIFLVGTTAFYAWKTSQMTGLMYQANKVQYRPYVVIHGAPNTTLLNMAVQESGKSAPNNLLTNPSGRTFSIANDLEGMNYILYSLKNIGAVTARNISHEITAYEISRSSGKTIKSTSAETDTITKRSIIMPNQSLDRTVRLGKGVAYKKTVEPMDLEIELKVYYDGDKNSGEKKPTRYYSLTRLRAPIVEKTQEASKTISIIDQDEGIVPTN